MSKLFDASKTKTQVTLNGAVTHQSSLNANVDLFFKIGSLRSNPSVISEDMFWKAYDEDAETAVRILLYSRDVRGGMGERNIFRKTFRNIAMQNPELAKRLLVKIPELGRWDDILAAIGTPVQAEAIDFIIQALTDKSRAALVAKWMPRMRGNATSANKVYAKTLTKAMKLSYQEYNKMLSTLSDTVEQKLSRKDYSEIDYSKLPSLAASRYQRLFNRVDSDRYTAYKEALIKDDGSAKVNAGAVYPYDIVKSVKYGDQTVSNAQWKALPDYMEGTSERLISVVDVSSSMESRVAGETSAMDVAISLGLYIAERNTGVFRNKMITFEDNPHFIEVSDSMTIGQKVNYVRQASWGGSTDLQKTFDVILDLAISNRISENEMPTKILIVSDMEFNQATGGYGSWYNRTPQVTNFEAIRQKYEVAGYQMPQIVFWNVHSKQLGNSPVQVNDQGVALVSGFSPSVMKGVLTGDLNPVNVVKTLVNVPRYDF
jgi:hypothetical protein